MKAGVAQCLCYRAVNVKGRSCCRGGMRCKIIRDSPFIHCWEEALFELGESLRDKMFILGWFGISWGSKNNPFKKDEQLDKWFKGKVFRDKCIIWGRMKGGSLECT